MRYKGVEWKDLPNKPLILGSQPIIFLLPKSTEKYVIHFRGKETKCYRKGPLGIIVSHHFDSESSDDIEGSVIQVKLYELDEAKDGESKELARVEFFSTSKGCNEESFAGDEFVFSGTLVKTRAQLQQTIGFLDGFIGIVPEPPKS